MKMILRTGPAVAGLGLFFGLLSGCGGSEGSSGGGSGGSNGVEESTTSQAEDSSSSGNAEASSDGEASTTGEGSGGSESGAEGSSTDGESSSTDGEGSGGATDAGESSSTDGEGEGTGGATDAGETSSTDGEGSGGSTQEGCPEQRPAAEAACEGSERECSYEGDCGNQTVVCREGQWRSVPSESDVAEPSCDSVAEAGFPENGDSCACLEELRCEFDDCGERGHITAVCNGESWTVEASACEVPRCGPGEGDSALFCEAEQVCVATQEGEEVNYACETNPCESETSCECASELCGDSQCQIREEGLVVACVVDGGN